jgi:PAS domain S-box-containing protein
VSDPRRTRITPLSLPHDLDQEPLAYQLSLKDRALATAVEGITISDLRLPDNPLVYVNRGFSEITGYSREEGVGKNCRYLQGPGTDPETIAEIRAAISERRACVVEILNYRHDGTPFWNRLSLTPLRDASGEVTHYIGVQSDVTKEREALDALHETKARLEKAHARMKRNLQAAAFVQRSLLPDKVRARDEVSFAWHLDSSDELAGDTLNIFELDDDHVGMYVLDVSGHGVPAALLSVALHRWLSTDPDRSTLRTDRPRGSAQILSPDLVARQLNAEFPMDTATAQYFTVVYGILNLSRREFRYVSAGHPPPIHLTRDGEVRQLDTGGMPIGFMPDAEYKTGFLQLEPGDRVFLYSDGLTESENDEGEFFDVERALDAIRSSRAEDLTTALQSVVNRAQRWRNHRSPEDDLTLLGFEVS